MKVCSAWNWDTLDYTHYKCPGKLSAGGWSDVNPATGPKAPPKDPIGNDIEEFLPVLPLGCVAIGRSARAKGQIVRAPSKAFNGFGETSTVFDTPPQRSRTPVGDLVLATGFMAGLVWVGGRMLSPVKK